MYRFEIYKIVLFWSNMYSILFFFCGVLCSHLDPYWSVVRTRINGQLLEPAQLFPEPQKSPGMSQIDEWMNRWMDVNISRLPRATLCSWRFAPVVQWLRCIPGLRGMCFLCSQTASTKWTVCHTYMYLNLHSFLLRLYDLSPNKSRHYNWLIR